MEGRPASLLVSLTGPGGSPGAGLEALAARLRAGRFGVEVRPPVDPESRRALWREVGHAVLLRLLGDRAPLWLLEGFGEALGARGAGSPLPDPGGLRERDDLALERIAVLAATDGPGFARAGGPVLAGDLVAALLADDPNRFRALLADLRFLLLAAREGPVRREVCAIARERLEDPDANGGYRVEMSARLGPEARHNTLAHWRDLWDGKLSWDLPFSSRMKLWAGVCGATGVSFERHPELRDRGELVTWPEWEWEARPRDTATIRKAAVSYYGDDDRYALLNLVVVSPQGVTYVFQKQWEL